MLSRIISDYARVKDCWGFVTPEGKVCQNGVRFTSEYAIVLYRYTFLPSQKNLRDQLVRIYQACEKEPGLLKRTPNGIHSDEQDGPDNYISAIAVSAILGDQLAERIWNYGKRNWFYFKNGNEAGPSLKPWLGRFPGFRAHLLWAMENRKPNWFRRIGWLVAIFWATLSKRDNQDSWVLSWFMIMCFNISKKNSWSCRKMSKRWTRIFKAHYPGGIGQVIGEYFQKPKHPTSIYLRNEFGEP